MLESMNNAIMDWSKIGQDVVINAFNHVDDWINHYINLSGEGTHLVVGDPEAGQEGAGQVKAYELADAKSASLVSRMGTNKLIAKGSKR